MGVEILDSTTQEQFLDIFHSVCCLRFNLESLANLQGEGLSSSQEELAEWVFGQEIFNSLPVTVVSLEIRDGKVVNRDESSLEGIDRRSREKWTLPEVDKFAGFMAQLIGIDWISVFISSED